MKLEITKSRTIEELLKDKKLLRKFKFPKEIISSNETFTLKKLKEQMPKDYFNMYKLAETDPEYYSSNEMCPLKNVIDLISERIAPSYLRLYRNKNQKKFFQFHLINTLAQIGFDDRLVGIKKINHPYGMAKILMNECIEQEGLTYGLNAFSIEKILIRINAIIPHDNIEEISETDEEINHNLFHFNKAQLKFIDNNLKWKNESKKKTFKEKTKTLTAITEQVTKKKAEDYSNYARRLISLPDKKTLKFYEAIGFTEPFKKDLSSSNEIEEVISAIKKLGWKKNAEKYKLPNREDLVKKIINAKKYLIKNVILPAIDVKLSDRIENTIEIYEKTSEGITLDLADRNRMIFSKNIDILTNVKKFLNEVEEENLRIDISLSYRLMEKLRIVSLNQTKKSLKESYQTKKSSKEPYIKELNENDKRGNISTLLKTNDFAVWCQTIQYRKQFRLYDKHGGLEKATEKEETKIPLKWYHSKKTFDGAKKLDGILGKYIMLQSDEKTRDKSKVTYNTLRRELIAFNCLFKKLEEKEFLPNYWMSKRKKKRIKTEFKHKQKEK